MIKLWHATNPESAQEILSHGVNFDFPRQSDVGDFGWGFYLTGRPERARTYGSTLLEVMVDPTRLAHVPNPYFLEGLNAVSPATDVEHLFHSFAFDGMGKMMTCSNAYSPRGKEAKAKAIRQAFIAAGWAGIITARDDRETVIFTSRWDAIGSIKRAS